MESASKENNKKLKVITSDKDMYIKKYADNILEQYSNFSCVCNKK